MANAASPVYDVLALNPREICNTCAVTLEPDYSVCKVHPVSVLVSPVGRVALTFCTAHATILRGRGWTDLTEQDVAEYRDRQDLWERLNG